MEKAVVLVSGGLNSAVAAAAAEEHCAPALLHIGWGHRTAERERQAFDQITAFLHVESSLVVELDALATMGGNARTSKKLAVEDAKALGHGTPATFALGVMPTMLSVAATWAGAIGAKKIIVGISENHGTPGPALSEMYPDHRREFIQAFNLMLQYCKPTVKELVVEAPLIEMGRVEVIRLGERLSVPFDQTWTCYRENDKPCGRCHPCTSHTAGFLRAGVPDPLLLEPTAAH